MKIVWNVFFFSLVSYALLSEHYRNVMYICHYSQRSTVLITNAHFTLCSLWIFFRCCPSLACCYSYHFTDAIHIRIVCDCFCFSSVIFSVFQLLIIIIYIINIDQNYNNNFSVMHYENLIWHNNDHNRNRPN